MVSSRRRRRRSCTEAGRSRHAPRHVGRRRRSACFHIRPPRGDRRTTARSPLACASTFSPSTTMVSSPLSRGCQWSPDFMFALHSLTLSQVARTERPAPLSQSLLVLRFGALRLVVRKSSLVLTSPLCRRRATGSQVSKPNSSRAAGAGGSSNTMLKLYTDDSPGLRVCVCLQISLVFLSDLLASSTETPSLCWSSPSPLLPPSSSSTSPPRSSAHSPSKLVIRH